MIQHVVKGFIGAANETPNAGNNDSSDLADAEGMFDVCEFKLYQKCARGVSAAKCSARPKSG
jgi:hypothetical protein